MANTTQTAEYGGVPPIPPYGLATVAFTGQAHNLILVGGTGTGKTHLATVLGIAAIHLVNQME